MGERQKIRSMTGRGEGERLRVAPITVKAALKQVKVWHRRLPDLQGGLFAARVIDGSGECVGVAIAGHPSQVWMGTGRICISRVAAVEGLPKVIDSLGREHAAPSCTKLYSALCKASRALGYTEAWTYTMPDESGVSLRAAGFTDMGLTDGGEYDRPSRPRKPAKNSEKKRRWMRRLVQEQRSA